MENTELDKYQEQYKNDPLVSSFLDALKKVIVEEKSKEKTDKD